MEVSRNAVKLFLRLKLKDITNNPSLFCERFQQLTGLAATYSNYEYVLLNHPVFGIPTNKCRRFQERVQRVD